MQVPGQLRQAWAAQCRKAAAPWPLNDGVEPSAVCRVNRRAGVTGEAGVRLCQAKTERERGTPPAPLGAEGPAWGWGWGFCCCCQSQHQLPLEREASLHPPPGSSHVSILAPLAWARWVSRQPDPGRPRRGRGSGACRGSVGSLAASSVSPAPGTVLGPLPETGPDGISAHAEPDRGASSPGSLVRHPVI